MDMVLSSLAALSFVTAASGAVITTQLPSSASFKASGHIQSLKNPSLNSINARYYNSTQTIPNLSTNDFTSVTPWNPWKTTPLAGTRTMPNFPTDEFTEVTPWNPWRTTPLAGTRTMPNFSTDEFTEVTPWNPWKTTTLITSRKPAKVSILPVTTVIVPGLPFLPSTSGRHYGDVSILPYPAVPTNGLKDEDDRENISILPYPPLPTNGRKVEEDEPHFSILPYPPFRTDNGHNQSPPSVPSNSTSPLPTHDGRNKIPSGTAHVSILPYPPLQTDDEPEKPTRKPNVSILPYPPLPTNWAHVKRDTANASNSTPANPRQSETSPNDENAGEVSHDTEPLPTNSAEDQAGEVAQPMEPNQLSSSENVTALGGHKGWQGKDSWPNLHAGHCFSKWAFCGNWHPWDPICETSDGSPTVDDAMGAMMDMDKWRADAPEYCHNNGIGSMCTTLKVWGKTGAVGMCMRSWDWDDHKTNEWSGCIFGFTARMLLEDIIFKCRKDGRVGGRRRIECNGQDGFELILFHRKDS